jgi:D-alanyl-D-alanine carboxypeptidase/D-alanyl-D-alanine-endopeptidase (penicillin-binding protein 4)
MSWNNIGTDSGTAISALTLDDNELPVVITPTQPGKPPRIEASPYLTLRNEVVTVAAGKRELRFELAVNGREGRIYGQIPLGEPFRERLGVDNPALYAAWTFQRMLEVRGVRVSGKAASRYRPAGLVDEPALRSTAEAVDLSAERSNFLAVLAPAPLVEDIAVINKVSQNLHAELLLRRVGRLGGTGSLADGSAEIAALLTSAGVPREGFDFSDGSGMSTYNRVSPRATVGLLRWALGQPWGATLRDSLPVGGKDGTLRRRFAATPLDGRVRAKTGTLNATNALGGYLQAESGQELVFAIYANDVPDGQSALAVMDAALMLVAARN